MGLSHAAPLVIVLAASGCIITNDFDDYTQSDAASGTSSTAAGVGGSSASSGASTSTSGAGGEGGCDADVMTDPANCGACGWDCAGGAGCVMGFCEPVGLTLPDAHRVGVQGDSVFVVAGTSCGTLGNIPLLSFPILFDSQSTPAFMASTFDSCGLNFYEGPDRAYYPPQAVGGETPLEVCDAGGCQRVEFGISLQHINGAAVAGDEIYFNILNGASTEIRKASLSTSGVPQLPISGALATVNTEGIGGQLIVFDPRTGALWWDTVGGSGCLYRAPLATLGGAYDCFAFGAADARSIAEMALAPTGGVVLLIDDGDGADQLWHVDDQGVETPIMPTVMGSKAEVDRGLASDPDYVYVGAFGGGFNVFDPVTWEQVGGKFHPFGLDDISAAHPDHVVYTGVDGSLWRQRKPPPPR